MNIAARSFQAPKPAQRRYVEDEPKEPAFVPFDYESAVAELLSSNNTPKPIAKENPSTFVWKKGTGVDQVPVPNRGQPAPRNMLMRAMPIARPQEVQRSLSDDSAWKAKTAEEKAALLLQRKLI
jgi:hypothetical protein